MPIDIDSRTLAGSEWKTKLREPTETLKPTSSVTYKHPDNSLSVRFITLPIDKMKTT